MKTSHYFSVLYTIWNFWLFWFLKKAPHNVEIYPTETWDYFDFLTTHIPASHTDKICEFDTFGQIFDESSGQSGKSN